MVIRIFFVLIAVCTVCLCCTNTSTDYLLIGELRTDKHTKFYKDFDIFSRRGIDEITGDTISFPFFSVQVNSDSSVQLGIYKKGHRKEITIPKDDRIIYDFDNVSDEPRNNYYRIFKDSIVVFQYENKIEEVEKWERDSIFLVDLLPVSIEIMTADTLYLFFQKCLSIPTINKDDTDIKISKKDMMKYAVHPFSRSFDLRCEDCLINYFDSTSQMRHYFRNFKDGSLSKGEPGHGQYGYTKDFKYWRDYYSVD